MIIRMIVAPSGLPRFAYGGRVEEVGMCRLILKTGSKYKYNYGAVPTSFQQAVYKEVLVQRGIQELIERPHGSEYF